MAKSLKKSIYNVVEKGEHGSKWNVAFDYGIMALIVLNVVAIIIETYPALPDGLTPFLRKFEVFSVIVFTIEYLLRLYIADLIYPEKGMFRSRIKFIFSFYGLIDLLAILPFYLPLFIVIDLRFLRILRLMRFFRLLKINRYNNSMMLIWNVLKEKKVELGITFFVTFLILIFFTFLLYIAEGPYLQESSSGFLTFFWWSVGAITKIKYLSLLPITSGGKIILGILAFLGIALIAIPTGIISSGFIAQIRTDKSEAMCPHCGKKLKNHE